MGILQTMHLPAQFAQPKSAHLASLWHQVIDRRVPLPTCRFWLSGNGRDIHLLQWPNPVLLLNASCSFWAEFRGRLESTARKFSEPNVCHQHEQKHRGYFFRVHQEVSNKKTQNKMSRLEREPGLHRLISFSLWNDHSSE